MCSKGTENMLTKLNREEILSSVYQSLTSKGIKSRSHSHDRFVLSCLKNLYRRLDLLFLGGNVILNQIKPLPYIKEENEAKNG